MFPRAKYRKIQIRMIPPSTLLFFCLSAIFSGSLVQTIMSPSVSYVIIIVIGCICLAQNAYRLSRRGVKRKGCYYLIIIIWLFLCSVVYPHEIINQLMRVCTISISFYISEKYSARGILKAFVVFSICIAIVALVGHYLQENTEALSALPRVQNLNEVSYRFGLIYNYIEIVPERICGFFWEPGLLGTCMIIAFLVYVIEFVQSFGLREILVCAILMICCFSTRSSASYALGALCIMALLLNKSSAKLRTGFEIVRFTLFLVVIFIIVNIDSIIQLTPYANEYEFLKLTSSGIRESNRMMAVLENLKLWVKNPIFGAGLTNAIENGKVVVADTSTSTFLMAAYGIGGIVYSIAILHGVFTQRHWNIYLKVLVCTIVIAIVNKEPHFTNVFSWILIFILLSESSSQFTQNEGFSISDNYRERGEKMGRGEAGI